MKILIINTYYYPNMVGGTEQSIKLLAQGLREKGYDIYILTGDRQGKQYEEIDGIKIIRLDLRNKSNIAQKLLRKALEFNNIRIKNTISNILDEIKPDVIHTNNLFYISPIVWKLANERNIKIVHTLRDYWGLCPKTTLLDKNMNICDNKKNICKLHSKNYMNFSKYVDIVTAPSDFTIDLYNKSGMFINASKCMIPNAIDIDEIEHSDIIERRNKIVTEEIKYLFMGSLDKHKGIQYLIETFRKIDDNNIRLTICGKGSLKSFVEEQAKEDSRITYLGSVFGDDKKRILMEHDVMIVPSIWYEPFGRVVIEAYKYGLVVIACKIGGINELLNDDVSIGVSIKNKEELNNAIVTLNNRENIKYYIKNMKQYILKYDLNRQIDKFIEVYNNKI